MSGRALWIGGIAFGIGLLLTGARVLWSPHLYRSSALILYERGALEVEPSAPQVIGARLKDLLMSRERLQRLIEQMRLYPAVIEGRGLAAAIDEMSAHLTLIPLASSNFAVSYDADDGDRAREVLTRLVSRVIDDDVQRREQAAEAARRENDAESRLANADLKTKEAAQAEFFAQHPQLALDGSGHLANSGRDSAAELASLEQRSAELEQQLADASRQAAPAAVPGTANPAVVAAQAKAAADLRAAEEDLNDKQTRLSYQHPDVKIAEGRVTELREVLHRADVAVAASAAGTSRPAAAGGADDQKVSSLRRALSAVRSRIVTLRAPSEPRPQVPRPTRSAPAIDAEGTRLALDVSEARERRRKIDAKLFQAQLLSTLGSAKQGGGFVVKNAPDQPRRPLTSAGPRLALVGGATSALIALIALIVAGRLDGRLYDTRDVARVLGPNLLVVVPKMGFKVAGRLSAKPMDSSA
jgi:hypothetical protein